jgi:hypothetical protein
MWILSPTVVDENITVNPALAEAVGVPVGVIIIFTRSPGITATELVVSAQVVLLSDIVQLSAEEAPFKRTVKLKLLPAPGVDGNFALKLFNVPDDVITVLELISVPVVVEPESPCKAINRVAEALNDAVCPFNMI